MYEPIDGVIVPTLICHDGRFWVAHRGQGPVCLVFRTFRDPALQQLLLGCAQFLVRFRRWHHVARVFGHDAFDERTPARLTGDDRRAAIARSIGRAGKRIQSQTGLRLAARAVAGEAAIRQQRTDLHLEVDSIGRITDQHQQQTD